MEANAGPTAATQLLRQAFAAFPTGVTLVTGCLPDGQFVGATVSSFTSISLDPPLVLVSLSRTGRAFPAWQTLDAFAVNVLSDQQESLSRKFANPRENKWEDVALFAATSSKAPLLQGSLAWFECRTWARYDGGDHLILIGLVSGFERNTMADSGPLVFFESRYTSLERLAP